MSSASISSSSGGGAAVASALPQPQPSPPKKSKKATKAATQAQTTKQPKAKGAKGDAKADATTAEASAKTKKAAGTGQEHETASSVVVAKKHPVKQQSFKIARDKERKDKQLKQAAAIAAAEATNTASKILQDGFNNSAASTGSRLQEMEPDGVKSRNRSLFLAPALRQRDPCWSGPSARDARMDSIAERLHDEIVEYANYTRATVDAMTVHIEQMITHVRRCVHALWPKSKMEPFGSYSTGIWLPSSDVDLVILGVVEIHDRMLTVKSLRQLATALESQPWVESLVVLDTAKIPVLKLVTAQSSVPIDITFESTATHSGLLARDLIKRYADEMPELYPLAVVFKQLLRERDLNDAYTGGLSSYSVVLMIIHFQLLWRYGERCFKAAALFASGSPLPRPADLIAEEKREKEQLASTHQVGKPDGNVMTAAPTATSSFAAVVSRQSSLKRPLSDNLRSEPNVEASATKSAPPPQPFSYAAVAAGIAKLSPEEPAKAPAPPSSYAAAVAAPPQATTPKATPPKSVSTPTKKDTLDAVSVTSSTADTEDCSDGSSTTTSAHEDAEHGARTQQEQYASQQEEPVKLSLGERTMTILEFFGIVFDYRKNGLSIRDGGYIYRLADNVGNSGDLGKKLPALVIEDPIHPDRNVSASSFAFSKVVAVFEDSFYALKYFRPTRFTPSALSCLLSTSGHSQHQYQQQFHHLLAGKASKSTHAIAAK